MGQGPFQTRACNGALCYYDTIHEALKEANKSHKKPDEVGEVVWKISFDSPSGERIRLVRSIGDSEWTLELMDDAIND